MCPTVCDPMDCSPAGSTVHGISQARILQWVAILFCRESSWPRGRTLPALQADSLPSDPPGNPIFNAILRCKSNKTCWDLYAENYKTLLKEIKEVLSKWGDIACYELEDNIVKISPQSDIQVQYNSCKNISKIVYYAIWRLVV